VVDTTKPVITLNGNSTENIHIGDSYIDAGVNISDNYDKNITANIVINGLPVNTTTIGTYKITYDAEDSSGNKATQITRIVNVSDDDMPVITLQGASPITLEVGNTYTDDGAIAFDNVDGTITTNIQTT
jgi:trimeric autotransporter adhesin